MATITDVTAMRIVFDLIKDSTVTTDTPYASCDQLGAADMLKYAEAIYAAYPRMWPLDGQDPPQPIPWASATNDQKADVIRDALRLFIRDHYVAFKRSDAAVSAGDTAASSAQAEADTDLGVV